MVVLTGAGDKSFCAGADLKAISRGEALGPQGTEEWGFAGFVNHPISKPVIVAVERDRAGWGHPAGARQRPCSFRGSAKFGLPEVRRGLIAAAGGLIRLPEQLPRKVAMQMIVTGLRIDAETALRWGLVNEVVPDGRVPRHAALDLARVIAANAPLAVQASKRVASGRYARRGQRASSQPALRARRLAGEQRGDRGADVYRGRHRGPDRLRREARAGVDGQVTQDVPTTSTS